MGDSFYPAEFPKPVLNRPVVLGTFIGSLKKAYCWLSLTELLS